MLVYTALLVPTTLAPVAVGLSGWVYGLAAGALGLAFLRHAMKVWRDDTVAMARPMFLFSILYLFLIFVFLLVDRVLLVFF
jgi:protoheme IX farnesyltransferase